MMRTVACLRNNCTLPLAGMMSTQVLHGLGFQMQNSRYILTPHICLSLVSLISPAINWTEPDLYTLQAFIHPFIDAC